jgi:hypothetical protein
MFVSLKSTFKALAMGSGFTPRGPVVGFCLLLLLVAAPGCLQITPVGNTDVIADGGNVEESTEEPASDEPAASVGNSVCDPFNNPQFGAHGYAHGLVGHLRYLNDDQPRYGDVMSYVNYGQMVDATLFMGKLDIPTRPFDRGFVTLDGDTVLNQSGNTLYEYFSLDLESQLELPESYPEGPYQFGLLADDGAFIEVDRGNGWEMLVNNDGTHPTKMMCATSALNMVHGQRYPIRVRYYQGPRYHIALILLFRPWVSDNPSAPLNDIQCGRSGNSRFFDSTKNPPAPQPAYVDMLKRGWEVVPTAAFQLPHSIASNPCGANHGGGGSGGGSDPVALDTLITSVSFEETITNSTEIRFEFEATRPGASFYCRLDNGATAACVSPVVYTGLAEGAHMFSVYAVDAVTGGVDTTPALHSWSVDTILPQLTAVSFTASTNSATISWSTNELTTGDLYWGLGTAVNQFLAGDGLFRLNHELTINGLNPNTVYSYLISGVDQAGNPVNVSRRVLRTAPMP